MKLGTAHGFPLNTDFPVAKNFGKVFEPHKPDGKISGKVGYCG